MNESPEFFALGGAIVGGGVTFGVTWLKHWLSTRASDKLEAKRIKTIQWMLKNPRYRARSLDAIAGALGESPEVTKRLLILAGAYPFNKGKVWSLETPED